MIFASSVSPRATVKPMLMVMTLGYGAPTCSLSDFIGTDLLVIFGSDLPNNQPVTAKYMHYAKKAGTRIVVVFSRSRMISAHIGHSLVLGTILVLRIETVSSGRRLDNPMIGSYR